MFKKNWVTRFLSLQVEMITVLLFCVMLFSACGSRKSNEAETPASTDSASATVTTFILDRERISSSLEMPGELVAWQQVDLYAKVNSFVKKLYVDVGSEVKAGQILASMDAPELASQLAGAESRLKSMEALYIASKSNYDRLLETSKTPGTVSPNDLDQAMAKQQSDNAQLQAARAAYREVGDNRNYLEIRAPFSGVISIRNISAGAYVGPSGKGSELPLFTLQDYKKLRLVVAVPELYSSYLRSNEISFSVRSLPGEKFTAKIARQSGALDNRFRSQRVEMDVLNEQKKLLPGMVAEVSIPMPAKDSVFVVPETAIINGAEGIFVIKLVNKKAIWVPVHKARTVEAKVEVFGNLSVGDSLVLKANEEIRDGSEVRGLKVKSEKGKVKVKSAK